MAFYINLNAMRLKVMDAAFSSVDEDTVFDIMDDCIEPDVAPVVHGRWKKILRNHDGTSDYECSACLGLILDVPDNDEHELVKYCPNCGCRMDLEND